MRFFGITVVERDVVKRCDIDFDAAGGQFL